MPTLEKLCTVEAKLAMDVFGAGPGGTRIEGTATGPHWEGERPVKGVDYVTVRSDGNMDLDIRGGGSGRRRRRCPIGAPVCPSPTRTGLPIPGS